LYIIATRGEAYRVLQARPAISKMLSKEIEMMTEKTSKKLGKSADVTLKRLSADLLSPDRDAVLPQIKLVLPKEEKDTEEGETKQSVLLEGLAVFRGDKLTGWLNADETRGYLFIAEKLSATHIYLPVQLNGQWFSYTIGMSKSKVKPELSGDQLRIRVSIETQGSIMESGNSNMTPEDIDQMEIAAAEAIQELAFKAIDKAKEYDADFLGLMQKLHRSDLTAWEKIKPDWREYFQNADIEVEVKASITNAGQIGAKPQISK
jgi:spore germination protein KC